MIVNGGNLSHYNYNSTRHKISEFYSKSILSEKLRDEISMTCSTKIDHMKTIQTKLRFNWTGFKNIKFKLRASMLP